MSATMVVVVMLSLVKVDDEFMVVIHHKMENNESKSRVTKKPFVSDLSENEQKRFYHIVLCRI